MRVPAHEVARTLLRAVGRPVAAPSANRSGRVSPTTAAHVLDGLGGRIAAVLDSGPCPVGVESTVLDLSGEQPALLRPGGVTLEAIEAAIGPVATGKRRRCCAAQECSPPTTPRACRCGWRAERVGPDEALLAFGPPLPGAGAVFQLSATGDLTEAAANLFAGLRALDASGCAAIAVMKVPAEGLGLAINDRLERAAAGSG